METILWLVLIVLGIFSICHLSVSLFSHGGSRSDSTGRRPVSDSRGKLLVESLRTGHPGDLPWCPVLRGSNVHVKHRVLTTDEAEGCSLSPVHEVQSCIETDDDVFLPTQTSVTMGTTCVIHVCDVLKFAVCEANGRWTTREGVLTFPKRCDKVLRPNTRRKRGFFRRVKDFFVPPPPPPPPPPPTRTKRRVAGVCGNPGEVSNADIAISSTIQGGTATYSCRAGYQMTSGNTVRICQSNEAWSGSEPYCTYMNSCDSTPCQNGATCANGADSYTCTCSEIWRGSHCEEIAYVCARDPCEHAESCVDGVDMYTCNCLPGWAGQICDIPADCGHPGDVDHAHVTVPTTTLGNTATYSCNHDYNMTTGAATRECQTDATWSGAPPTCVYVKSCDSSPCQNEAPCVNGLGDYTCVCTDQWSGVNCETDIQPPVIVECSADIHVNATSSTAVVTWTPAAFVDPLGNDVNVISNYNTPEYEFPWGDFTVQYTAVKPLNGMKAECVFEVFVRPTPCQQLNIPVNGAKLCNAWKSDFGRFCLVSCRANFSISPGLSYGQWHVCGASGQWMAAAPLPDCAVEFADDADVLPYHPSYASYTFTSCDDHDDVIRMKQLYVNRLNKTNGFGAFCVKYEEECHVDNVIFEC